MTVEGSYQQNRMKSGLNISHHTI